MTQPTEERENEAVRSLTAKMGHAIKEWRKEFPDICDAPQNLRVFGGGFGLTLIWFIESHYPDKKDALDEMDRLSKAWRLTFEQTDSFIG